MCCLLLLVYSLVVFDYLLLRSVLSCIVGCRLLMYCVVLLVVCYRAWFVVGCRRLCVVVLCVACCFGVGCLLFGVWCLLCVLFVVCCLLFVV